MFQHARAALIASGEDKATVDTFPVLVRVVLDREGFDYRDSHNVENAMAEIQHAIDDVFGSLLGQYARLVATGLWTAAGKPPVGKSRAPLLALVVKLARDAAAFGPDAPFEPGPKGEPWASGVGLFRSAFRGLDMTVPGRSRTLHRRIKRAARHELDRPIPGSPGKEGDRR